ncbi:MAG: glycosyltransferase family 2 protein [Planctomycetota bacterium]|nr:MAG: glycosyltransferase family 2 protein [Planctomycetota bacterium]
MEACDKIPISVCIIAQNEEEDIADCLRSADFAEETLVLDGGSEDRTCAVAVASGARVERRAFDGWVSQKNAAVALAKHDWILSLDADERISPALREEILQLFHGGAEPVHCAYDLPRRAYHLGRWIRGGGWYPDRKLRLFCRRHARFVGRNPHDYVEYKGSIGHLRGDLLHYPYRDLFEHVARMDRYTTAAAQAAFEQGRRFPLLRMLLTPPMRFFKAYFLRAGFRDGRVGLILAFMAAVYELVRYAKLWDLYHQRRRRREFLGDPS